MIAAVPDHQPLAGDGIWRVTLAGEGFGRLVRCDEDRHGNAWQLLQIDELSDEQLDSYEVSMHGQGQDSAESPL